MLPGNQGTNCLAATMPVQKQNMQFLHTDPGYSTMRQHRREKSTSRQSPASDVLQSRILSATSCRFSAWFPCPVIDSGLASVPRTAQGQFPSVRCPQLSSVNSLFLAAARGRHFRRAASLSYTAHTRRETLPQRHFSTSGSRPSLMSHTNPAPQSPGCWFLTPKLISG